ncbi:MAG: hypothetical protein JO153_18040 [Solirubrobacterales bacterium]|nr:hypothetical protein [Solirubrobacterales bacterium]MBV9918403.1 hypothetical protein [Solirubrobacterales bacterium]
MNLRVIPRTAFTTSLRLARLPLDIAIGVLPGDGAGPKSRARAAVDRADATARSVAGTLMLDPELREDARRRSLAVHEREQAIRLRSKARRTTGQARARAEQRGQQAQRRRQQAESRASRRREQAEAEHERQRQSAAAVEERLTEASREVQERTEERIEETAPERRLDALQEKVEAQREAEQALSTRDEASRLGEAAAAVKEERTEH